MGEHHHSWTWAEPLGLPGQHVSFCRDCGMRKPKDSVGRLRTLTDAEVRDRTALLDRRLADLRRAALAVYHGKIGYDHPTDPDILALGVVLFPERASLAPAPEREP